MGGDWINVYAWLNPFTLQLKLSQHGQSAIPQYKINSLKIKRKSVSSLNVFLALGEKKKSKQNFCLNLCGELNCSMEVVPFI